MNRLCLNIRETVDFKSRMIIRGLIDFLGENRGIKDRNSFSYPVNNRNGNV